MFQSFKLIFEMAERYFYPCRAHHPGPRGLRCGRQPEHLGHLCRLVPDVRLHVPAHDPKCHVYQDAPVCSLVLSKRSRCSALDGSCLDDRQGCQKDRRDYHPHRPESGNYRGSPWANLPRRPDLSRYENSGRTGLKDHWEGRRRIQPRQAAPYAARQSQRPQVRWFRGGRWAHFSKTAGSAYTYTSTHSAQQSAAAQTQTHQKPPPGDSPQGVTAHTAASASSPPDSVPSEGAAGPNGRNGLPGQDVHTKQESRKSAVPSGARRAPSHVKAAAGGAAAGAAAAVVSGKAGRGSRGGPDGTVPGRPGSSSAGTPEAASPAGASRSTRIPLHDSPCGPAGIRNQGAGPAHASGDHGREQKCAPREAKSRARRHPAVHLAPAPDPLPIWITRTPEAVLPAGRLRARTKVHAQSPGRPAPAPQEPCMPRYRSIHVSKRHNTPEMVRRRLHIRHTPIRHGRNPVRLPLPTRLPGGGPLLRQVPA